MKSLLLFFVLIVISNGFLSQKKQPVKTDHRVLANVKIYSNLAEISQPLGKLPIEFSHDDWVDIRPDSVTLVGKDVNITQQTITEKKNSLNNVEVYVRSPSSSSTETKFIKATMIDEKRRLVKMIDKDISRDPIFFTVPSDHIVYDTEPPQSKYYVNFTYDTTDSVSLSYLRSNLNWKTSYQLSLFEESKAPKLIAMADIRNDGQSKVDIDHAELLGGDINLQMHQKNYVTETGYQVEVAAYAGMDGMSASRTPVPSVRQGEEVAGLYVYAINQPFSIEAKTNHLLPMFRPRVTVEKYASISKHFYDRAGSSQGKAQRSYRLSSDHFLSRGNCIIRESDRLVGETMLPNLAAKDKHEFSLGEDADIIYKENATLISSQTFNATTSIYGRIQSQTKSTYDINVVLKNFKKNRPVKVEYEQNIHGTSIKLMTTNADIKQHTSKIKYQTTIPANDEKLFSYKVEIIN